MNRLSVLLVAGLLTAGGTARAEWEGEKHPAFLNAYSLQSLEVRIGLLQPTGLGFPGGLQLSTVLLWDCFGIVNVDLKWTALDLPDVALAVDVGGFDWFLAGKGKKWEGVRGRLTATFPAGRYWLLTGWVGLGWIDAPRFDDLRAFDLNGVVGAEYGTSAAIVIDTHNLVELAAVFGYDWEYKFFTPLVARLVYAHAWDIFHLAVGLSMTTEPWEGIKAYHLLDGWPVVPFADLWWRW